MNDKPGIFVTFRDQNYFAQVIVDAYRDGETVLYTTGLYGTAYQAARDAKRWLDARPGNDAPIS